MNFDFSDEQKSLQEEARKFLAAECPSATVRRVLDGPETHDERLWHTLGDLGFLGAAIPEEFGGGGYGYLELCVIADELGRALAPVPFVSSIALAAEFIKRSGSQAQKRRYLPGIASGRLIGTFADSEGAGRTNRKYLATKVDGASVCGEKFPVLDAMCADFAIVTAREEGVQGFSLFIVDLHSDGVRRVPMQSVDPTRKQGCITLSNAACERLGAPGTGPEDLAAIYACAAVVTAFEQVGGADRALELARDYSLQRYAFGRPIGSFQAMKHMMAEMYVSATLARSNAYYGAWALAADAPELPAAASYARIAASTAYQQCARDCIQVHGGMGFTWDFDCHLHYRRAGTLSSILDGLLPWERQLVQSLSSTAPQNT